jgi:hypothetical protein
MNACQFFNFENQGCYTKLSFFIVQFKAHGKVAVYGGVHYVSCMFVILLVGVKLNHAVMEQDFQL